MIMVAIMAMKKMDDLIISADLMIFADIIIFAGEPDNPLYGNFLPHRFSILPSFRQRRKGN